MGALNSLVNVPTLLKPLKSTPVLMLVYNKVRTLSPYMAQDRSLSGDIGTIADLIKNGALHKIIEEAGLQLH